MANNNNKYVLCNKTKYYFTTEKELKAIQKQLSGRSYQIVDGCLIRPVLNQSALAALIADCGKAKDNSK